MQRRRQQEALHAPRARSLPREPLARLFQPAPAFRDLLQEVVQAGARLAVRRQLRVTRGNGFVKARLCPRKLLFPRLWRVERGEERGRRLAAGLGHATAGTVRSSCRAELCAPTVSWSRESACCGISAITCTDASRTSASCARAAAAGQGGVVREGSVARQAGRLEQQAASGRQQLHTCTGAMPSAESM